MSMLSSFTAAPVPARRAAPRSVLATPPLRLPATPVAPPIRHQTLPEPRPPGPDPPPLGTSARHLEPPTARPQRGTTRPPPCASCQALHAPPPPSPAALPPPPPPSPAPPTPGSMRHREPTLWPPLRASGRFWNFLRSSNLSSDWMPNDIAKSLVFLHFGIISRFGIISLE
ncbi:hypothetical protein BS78_04G077400 [Paspalum vaginatum]|nr:hypothetical protein BS78_04G077400 [Paspalum vaginatum]KAJ1278408.1 hypothetical protein BS78_04G077400 [Paspalum vaginatum]KAJ1278409.1 hypothetical protein BS78_04G077400 [Paspalum vaginatum]KAJ1278410.1 hypothetical protein BS78_04G077400 [Paspalum vaginatum]